MLENESSFYLFDKINYILDMIINLMLSDNKVIIQHIMIPNRDILSLIEEFLESKKYGQFYQVNFHKKDWKS